MSPSRPLIGALAALLLTLPPAARAGTTISVKPFRSVTLRSGGEVILRPGSKQKVTMLEGNQDCVRVEVEDGDLVIETTHHGCRKGDDLTVEVITPDIEEVMVTDGGTLRSLGAFPPSEKLLATVSDGGMLDIRSMKADEVLATVNSGGRILTRPVKNLLATVLQGGNITYWGEPHVISTIQHGGHVGPGKSGDAGKPLSEVAR